MLTKRKTKKKKSKKSKSNKNITLNKIKKKYTIKHAKLDIRPTSENTFRLNWWYNEEKESGYWTNPSIIKSLVIKIVKNNIKEFPELGFDKSNFLK